MLVLCLYLPLTVLLMWLKSFWILYSNYIFGKSWCLCKGCSSGCPHPTILKLMVRLRWLIGCWKLIWGVCAVMLLHSGLSGRTWWNKMLISIDQKEFSKWETLCLWNCILIFQLLTRLMLNWVLISLALFKFWAKLVQ